MDMCNNSNISKKQNGVEKHNFKLYNHIKEYEDEFGNNGDNVAVSVGFVMIGKNNDVTEVGFSTSISDDGKTKADNLM